MSKIIINEDQYIKLCNDELRNHPLFENGMEIMGTLEGNSGIDLQGLKWKGPGMMSDIVAQVQASVKIKYELQVTSYKN